MKLIRTIAMLGLSCGLAAGFPASSPRTAVVETFTGGADSFDLNLHSLTLVPYESGSNQNQFRYPSYYNVRPIRNLPVDMSDAAGLVIDTSGNSPVIAVPGLPTIHGIALSSFQVSRSGEVVFKNASGASQVTMRVLKCDAFANGTGFLILESSWLKTADGRLAIQFDYDIDPQYGNIGGSLNARPLVRNVFQLEVFPDGMIRYSYFSVDVTIAEVGLFSSVSSSTGGELDFSAAILRAPDIVRNENSGPATVGLELAANVTASFDFQYSTSNGSAVAPSDYTALAGSSSIATGSRTAELTLPISNDTLDESPESFDLVVHAPGNPEWIFATPRIWILDDDAPASGTGPRIDLSGNRVFVLPPDPSPVTITGFRLLSLSGGTLLNPRGQVSIQPNTVFSLEAGAAGLIASGPGIHFTVEAIHSGGTSMPVGFDLDGSNASPVFNLTSDRTETTEGGFASLGVSASHAGASVSYQMFPVSAQPSTDYAPLVKTLEFKDGLAGIEIPVFADGITEGTEEFVVRLINPSPGSFIGPVSRVKVVVKDGGGALRSPTFQILPDPRPSGRVVNRNQATSPVWRFIGEPLWRQASSHAWNVREGLHQMDFRANASVWKLYMAPESYLSQQGTINDLSISYSSFVPALSGSEIPVVGTNTGSLQVVLLPAGTTGQWRRLGETTWRNSGVGGLESGVPVGTQVVEFKDTVSGYDAPSIRPVRVLNGATSNLTATYQIRPSVGVDPAPIPEPDLRVSSAVWSHIPISPQTGNFRVSFEYKPSGTGIVSLIGLSSGLAAGEADLSAPMRLISSGFQGWASTVYGTDNTLAPVLDQWYFVEFQVNPATGKYDLYVTPPTGPAAPSPARVTIRSSDNFRAAATELSYLSMSSSTGSHSIRGLRVEKTHPFSTWKIVEFPDQVSTFDLALELQIRTASFPAGDPFRFLFGLSDDRAVEPTALIGPVVSPGVVGPVVLPQPANLGAVGRYAPIAVRLHADLAADTYEIRGETGTLLDSGSLPPTLARARHFYLKPFSSSDVAAYSIADSILPPATIPPTGTGAAATWSHIPITPQTGRFSLTCDIRAVGQTVGTGDLIDSLFGVSATRVTLESQIAVALRAKLPATGVGTWDAHTGGPGSGNYAHEGDLPVVDGKLYHATFQVDVPAKTYRISITPDDGGPVVIQQQGTFRDQAAVLRYLTLRSVQGRLEVTNMRGPLPHPLDSAAHFTGQIESPNGFGSGTVVADHAVLTSARLVFDSSKLTFTPGITWRRSEGGYAVVPDACEPSHVVLVTGYAAALLNGTDGDSLDVAVLAFRPLDIPETDNSPGGGCFSGFLIDDGSGGWTGPAVVKQFPSFPVSGTSAANPGRVHATSMGGAVFAATGSLLHTASGIRTPPGSEGAAVFVQGADQVFRPAAVCTGAAGGLPRFRSIDAGLAEAIHQANGYQRQPGILQDFQVGGVYYINQTLATSAEPNRAHILSNAIPPAATWTLKRYTSLVSSGGQAVSVEPGSYQVLFGAAPPGYTRTGVASLTRTLTTGTTWNLPAVYTADPPSSYDTWVDAHYDAFEATSPAAAAAAPTPWLGIDNLTAYAFGFDPKVGPVRNADPATWTPGYPLVTINRTIPQPTAVVDVLRRIDPNLNYEIQYADALSGWVTHGTAPQVIATQGVWQHVRWTISLPGQTGRKFVRTRVTLAD